MQIIQGTTKFQINDNSAVAIGKFDGIHKGHQLLLREITKDKTLKSVIFTFDPPASSFFNQNEILDLTTRDEKRAIFEEMGIDILVEFPLTKETASIEPEVFIEEYLIKNLRAKKIVAGTDLSFGYKGKGNVSLLECYQDAWDFDIEICDKVCRNEREISSTYVRDEIKLGNMEIANEMLGMPYNVRGKVVKGNQFGRTIGIPTANIIPPANKLLPPNGVYFSYAYCDGIKYCAISNIGYKPTVSKEKILGVETYFYDFNEDLYGKNIVIELLHYKRPEMKFDTKQSLTDQMNLDKHEGRNYFSTLLN